MKAPFYNPRVWLRVFLKALSLLLIFDLLFISLRPFDLITPLSLFGPVLPYRTRLVVPERDVAAQLMPLETLLNAHEISRSKSADEYRVVILGDSGINGWGNIDSETVSAYLTASNAAVKRKKIYAYNLAYIQPGVTRDLLIADAALAYSPDLIICFVTLDGFSISKQDRLFEANQARATRLTVHFDLDDINARIYGHYPDVWWQRSIFVQRAAIYRWLAFQSYALRRANFLSVSAVQMQESNPEHAAFTLDDPAFMPLPNASWIALTAMQQLSPVPVLFVNDPILIVPGAQVNYNEFYQRALYDQYDATFSRSCKDHNLWCLDLWNILPPKEFTDSPLHHTANGNAIIAARALEAILTHFADLNSK